MFLHATSINAQALFLLRGSTVCQVSGKSAVIFTFQSLSRIRRTSPHCLTGVTGILLGVGGRDGDAGSRFVLAGYLEAGTMRL